LSAVGQTDADRCVQASGRDCFCPRRTPGDLHGAGGLAEVHPVASQIALDLLFASSAQALQDLAGQPRRLGAQLGMLGVLHTWSPHAHLSSAHHYLFRAAASAERAQWLRRPAQVPPAG